MSDPYPGHAEAVQRWNIIRAKCCQPGWLDHIKVEPSPHEEIAALRAESAALRAKLADAEADRGSSMTPHDTPSWEEEVPPFALTEAHLPGLAAAIHAEGFSIMADPETREVKLERREKDAV